MVHGTRDYKICTNTQKTLLEHYPIQTYNTETAFSAARFSELVQKTNAGVINQQNSNPGFTFKAGPSAQPTTGGSSNVNGQQSGKLQANPKGRSKNSKKHQFKLYSEVLDDVTVTDGTILAPFTKVTKIWKMRNNGTIAWPQGSKLQWITGDLLSHNFTVDVMIQTDGLPVNAEIDVTVDIIAPRDPGRYFLCWRMMSPSGEFFGKFISVSFQVVKASSMKSVPETSTNVNQPSVVKNPEVVDASTKAEGKTSTNANLPPVAPVVKNVVVVNQEMVSGNKLVSGSDSVFDSKQVKTALETALESARVEASSDDQEQGLLNDLEKMGFKQLDLNKEILKKNNYDLKKSIDDLCGVSEWDLID
ncbi:protein JOKA2-like [Rutidosis leptorrhynchoides]|uniref:protein JOKA2-like n=1 Tax=Rutidosis leptorrhynchoides TaxID=125765 RepID=UPI003A98F922